MKTDIQIGERLKNLQTNISKIRDEQGKEITQGYINALKWVLSKHEDVQEELNRRIK